MLTSGRMLTKHTCAASLAIVALSALLSGCGFTDRKPDAPDLIIEPATLLAPDITTDTPQPEATGTTFFITPSPQSPVPLRLEPGIATFTVPLHLQHKSQDQLVVMFELAQPVEGKLYWWPIDGAFEFANYVAFGQAGPRHVITIDELLPGQRYQLVAAVTEADGYDRIPAFLGEQWGPIEVATLPSATSPLKVGVFGDSGFGEEVTSELAQKLSEQDPDLVLHTGDLVYLSYQEGEPLAAYQHKWYATLESLLKKTVIYPVIGNHEYDSDIIEDGRPYYFETFPMLEGLGGGWQNGSELIRREWYALEYGSLQVILLNSQQLYGGSARQEQDAWLVSRLADNRFKTTIVVFHIPPFTSGRHHQDGAAVLGSWVPRFEASNVALVVSGHDHNYERLERGGITYLVSGGGSRVLYPLGTRLVESQRFAVKTHYALLELTPEEIIIRAYDLEGELIDEAIIGLANP